MPRLLLASILLGTLAASPAAVAADPVDTIRNAEQTLAEIMSIPARQIPQSLLAQARGIAIIPNVVKIGFIAGARRGHGVVLVRDAEGDWSLPQFITLTGGSVGWQAGISGTDVVLVFTTQKGVEGLLRGKFTIGADASVAAGPVGRNAAAATDATLQSEILSYSRSRGLFLGVSVDGTALEIDEAAHQAFYGSPSGQMPRQEPLVAIQLRQTLIDLTEGRQVTVAPVGASPAVPSLAGPGVAVPAVPTLAAPGTTVAAAPANRLESVRQALGRNSTQLSTILDPAWQKYLALPKEIVEGGNPPSKEVLETTLERYNLVATAKNAEYQKLLQRPEFQATYQLLHEYAGLLTPVAAPQIMLPPPPTAAAATGTQKVQFTNGVVR